FILLVNANTFLDAIGVSGASAAIVYVAIVVAWSVGLFFAISAIRRERRTVLEPETSEV
ncbi:MAG: hypothetical protein H0X23_01140, partial [Rubrobacter sp.]|nr:hypothetical protein [Rubrobacter sp.]